MRIRISVFGASSPQPGDDVYEAAIVLGTELAVAGYAVATGGYGGLMEAISRGAAEAGGHVVGVTAPPLFPNRDGANRWVTEEIPHSTLLNRIDDLVENSAAAIVLPGSIGTLAELTAFWNNAFISRFSGAAPRPLIAVGNPWRSLVPQLAETLATDGSLVTLVDDERRAAEELKRRLPL